jgi:hypothetical protein
MGGNCAVMLTAGEEGPAIETIGSGSCLDGGGEDKLCVELSLKELSGVSVGGENCRGGSGCLFVKTS